MRAPGWMVMTWPKDKSGPLSVNLRVRLWHPSFWWFVLKTTVQKVVYNRAFEWVHRHDDHVRVWQNGENCHGCDAMTKLLKDLAELERRGLENPQVLRGLRAVGVWCGQRKNE
jgi:hypothetical protein